MVDTRFSVSVHIMVTLAYHQDDLVNSEALAKNLKTNATFVRKLVSRLVEADLVQSYRGKNGGITLGKKASDITLKEIYCAMMEEKCLVGTANKPANKACAVSCSMSQILNNIVDGVENSTKSYLAKITLQDLLKKI
ncbi:MAG: RrF2 family transcriptional regulator [Bacteriovoracaceae bacterium]